MTKDVITIRELIFGSSEQKESIKLRDEILRKPLGLHFSDEELQNEHNQIHIGAFLDGRIVGILLLMPLSNTVIKMRQVAVDNNLQRKGIGKKLVLFAENYAKQQSFKEITLHARKSATEFYLNVGYQIEGNPFIEVGIPHYLIKKHI